MIRRCEPADHPTVVAIINDAAQVYRGAIPADCWHDPYMSQRDVEEAIAEGVEFWGCEESGALVAVMGLQIVRGTALIRHAYVRPDKQGRGIGGALLTALLSQRPGRVLVGTWAAAEWAIRFYQGHGFQLVPAAEKDRLLVDYWNITPRQRQTSVVLTRP